MADGRDAIALRRSSAAPTAPTASRASRARRLLARPTVQVLLVYAAARAVTTVALLAISTQLTAESRGGAAPGFVALSSIWDGQWYWFVAAYGYPSELPVDAAGHVLENQWAFMPLYPALASALAVATGLPWPSAAVLLSIACGFGAAVLMYRLFRERLPHGTALFAVTLFAVSPLSFILQMAYAESLQLLLLALALLLLTRRRYGWLVPVLAAMAFTRPTGLAFALLLAMYFVARLLRRDHDPFPQRERVVVVALTAWSGLLGFGWLLVAWAVTGSMTAYTDTELAWRAQWIGHQHLLPFGGWFQAAPFWLGPVAGPIAVVLLVLGFAAALLFVPAVRRLGVELRLWLAAYGIYLFAVFFPQSSLLRLLMPMFPLAGAFAAPRSVPVRVTLVIASLTLQLAWLWATWGPAQNWWSIP